MRKPVTTGILYILKVHVLQSVESSLQWNHTSNHSPRLPSQNEGDKCPKRRYAGGESGGHLSQRKRRFEDLPRKKWRVADTPMMNIAISSFLMVEVDAPFSWGRDESQKLLLPSVSPV